MNNYTENEVFEFGNNEENYNNINGLGDSSYENEDLFNTEIYSNDNEEVEANNKIDEGFNANSFMENTNVENEFLEDNKLEYINPFETNESERIVEEAKKDLIESDTKDDSVLEETEKETNPNELVETENQEETKDIIEEKDNTENEILVTEQEDGKPKIQMPNNDLTSLTQINEEKIETTDIKELFDKVGVNVKEASDIFKRNSEMKEKLDSRFEELKKLQLEVARKKEEQYNEINAYKEEVLNKLSSKKEEIERRLNKLKEYQASLEKEKEEFEQYRKKEKEEINRVQKEVQEAYDSRREELNHIEDVLRRQKDALDEERSQLSLDKIQYEADKNELANNLLKFNEIVGSFTNGIDKFDRE